MKTTLLLILVFVVNIGFAQDDYQNKNTREGFVIGAALGGGIIYFQEGNLSYENYGRFSVPNLKVGWMISPRTALLAYIPTGIYIRKEKHRAFEAAMPAIQYWIKDDLWILGGTGINLDIPVIGTSNEGFYFGPAFCVGIGKEFIKKGCWAADVQFRYQYGSTDISDIGKRQINGFGITVGLNRY